MSLGQLERHACSVGVVWPERRAWKRYAACTLALAPPRRWTLEDYRFTVDVVSFGHGRAMNGTGISDGACPAQPQRVLAASSPQRVLASSGRWSSDGAVCACVPLENVNPCVDVWLAPGERAPEWPRLGVELLISRSDGAVWAARTDPLGAHASPASALRVLRQEDPADESPDELPFAASVWLQGEGFKAADADGMEEEEEEEEEGGEGDDKEGAFGVKLEVVVGLGTELVDNEEEEEKMEEEGDDDSGAAVAQGRRFTHASVALRAVEPSPMYQFIFRCKHLAGAALLRALDAVPFA